MRGNSKTATGRKKTHNTPKSKSVNTINSSKGTKAKKLITKSPFTLSERNLITTTLTSHTKSQLSSRRQALQNGLSSTGMSLHEQHQHSRVFNGGKVSKNTISQILTTSRRYFYQDDQDEIPLSTNNQNTQQRKKAKQSLEFSLDWGTDLKNDKAPNAENSAATHQHSNWGDEDFFGGETEKKSFSSSSSSSSRGFQSYDNNHNNNTRANNKWGDRDTSKNDSFGSFGSFGGRDDGNDDSEDGIPVHETARSRNKKQKSEAMFTRSLQQSQPPQHSSQGDSSALPSSSFQNEQPTPTTPTTTPSAPSTPSKPMDEMNNQYDMLTVRQPKLDQSYQHRDFTPYNTFDNFNNNNNRNQNRMGNNKFGQKNDQFSSRNQRNFDSSNDRHHHSSFHRDNSLPEQRFDTMDADHDISRGKPGKGDSFKNNRNDRGFNNNNNNSSTHKNRTNDSYYNQSTLNNDINPLILAGPIARALKRLPNDEQLQYAIKRYLPFQPFRTPLAALDQFGHPTNPHSAKNQQPDNRRFNKNTFGMQKQEDEVPEINSNNDIFVIFSKLIETVRASHSSSYNSGTNHDSVHAHLGGRLNNAISSIFTAYRSRGLLLFVDVFHPFLNIVHWTRIFNSLILAKNYHTTVDLFEKFLLPNDISVDQQEIIDQINDPLNSSSSSSSNQSLEKRGKQAQQHALLTAVDQKLMASIITAYTRCRQPAELLTFLSTLEHLNLLPDPSSTKHLLTTICSNPGDYDAEVMLFNSKKYGTDLHPFYKNSLIHPNITFSMLMSFYHNFRKRSLLKLISNDQAKSKSLSTLIDKATSERNTVKKLSQFSSKSSRDSGSKSTHPLATDDQFIHTRGQLLQYSNMYAELGFLSALHGSLSESLKHQGMITLPNITSLFNLGSKMNRVDLIYGLVQNRYKYYTRHVGVGGDDLNRKLSSFFSQQSLHNISLPWANIHVPSSPLTDDTAGNNTSNNKTANDDTKGNSDEIQQTFSHSKDHFTHTVDYDNINLSDFGVDTPITTIVEKASEFDDVVGGKINQNWGHQLSKNTQQSHTNEDTTKKTTKTLSFPKFPSQKRFVMVQTGFGMGVEVYVNDGLYYAQHGVKIFNKKALKGPNSEVGNDQNNTKNDKNIKFNPYPLIAAITPSSNRFSEHHLPPAAKENISLFHSINPIMSTSNSYGKSTKSFKQATPSQLNILRHLQPDPVMIVSLKPKNKKFNSSNASNASQLAKNIPITPPKLHKRRRHVIDIALKRRQNVYVDGEDNNDEQKDVKESYFPQQESPVAISIMSIVPKKAKSISQQSNAVQRLQGLLSDFASRSTSTPLLQSKSSTTQFFNALANNRSYGLLAKASTFYTHHHHVYQRSGAKQTKNIIVGDETITPDDNGGAMKGKHHIKEMGQNLTTGPTKIVKTLLQNELFSHFLLTPSGQILNPQLRLLSRLNSHAQPPPMLLSDTESDDIDLDNLGNANGTKSGKKLTKSQIDFVSNLSPFSPIPFTPASLSTNVTNSPFDGIYVGTGVSDLAKKKAKKVAKPKFQIPLFLSPFLIQYEDATNHTEDQAELQAALHLLSSYPNTMDDNSLKKNFTVANDPQNAYYITVPSLAAQLQLQYPHIQKAVGKTPLTNTEIVNGQQMVRPGVAVCRRVLLGLVSRIINSQNRATNRILLQYSDIITEVINKEDGKLQRRTNSGFNNKEKDVSKVTKRLVDGDEDVNTTEIPQDLPQTLSELESKLNDMSDIFPMSNWYVSNESNPHSGQSEENNNTTNNKNNKHLKQSHSTSATNTPQHKHIYLSSTALQELKEEVTEWTKQSEGLSREILDFIHNYSTIPHPEVVDEYLNTILPFLIDLAPQLNFNPKFLEEVVKIGVDLALKSHFTTILTPTPSSTFRTKRAAAQATVDFVREETDFITTLDQGGISQLVSDSYLNSLGLPATSSLSFQVTNINENNIQSGLSLSSKDSTSPIPISNSNCSFSTPNSKTAPSVLHTKLLKLLATLSEVTQGTTVELSAQLSLASYISNEFSQRGDLNSTLIWATMAAHMKHNINKTFEKELRDGFVKTTPNGIKSDGSTNESLKSPFTVIASKIRPANSTAELLKPVDQEVKLAMDEVSFSSKNKKHQNHEDEDNDEDAMGTSVDIDMKEQPGDSEGNFHTAIQKHFEDENAKNKAKMDEVNDKMKKKQDKATSTAPYLPMSFYPSGTMSPDFILQVNKVKGHVIGEDQQTSQDVDDNGSRKQEFLLSSPFVQNFPQTIKPISNLGEILQLIPDTSLTPDISGGNNKTGSKMTLKGNSTNKNGKNLQQSLRSFEHALMLSESSSPLPRLMPSLVYLQSLQTIFQALVYSNLTSIDHFQQNSGGDDSHDNQLVNKKHPHLHEFSSVVNASYSAYRIFWHLLGSLEQKQIQHTIGIDTGALLQQAVEKPDLDGHDDSDDYDDDGDGKKKTATQRNFIYPSSSPALVTSLDQFLGQFDQFNLDTTIAQLLTVGAKLSSLPTPQRRIRNHTTVDNDGNEEFEHDMELKNENESLNARLSLLSYTDGLIEQILDIWEPKVKKNVTPNEDGGIVDNDGDDTIIYKDLLELNSPLSLNSQEPSLYGAGEKYTQYLPGNNKNNRTNNQSNNGKGGKHVDYFDQKNQQKNQQQQQQSDSNDHKQAKENEIYDPTVQSGPLSFAKPTPALIAAINTYVTNRLQQTNLNNPGLVDTNNSNDKITLHTFSRVQRAAKSFITIHSPNTLQQLEAFKLHRDHQKATALELINNVVDKPEVVEFLQTKRRGVENNQKKTSSDASASNNDQWSQYDGNDQEIATATDFAVVTPTTSLELEIDLVLEQIQTAQNNDQNNGDDNNRTNNDTNAHHKALSPSELDQLTHGKYPYPLTLTLSKTSSVSFQHPSNDSLMIKKTKKSNNQHDEGIYPTIAGDDDNNNNISSDDNKTGNDIDNPEWFPDRHELLSQLTQQGNSNVIKLNETGASIRMDSHLNSYDAISTLFNVNASLRSCVESITTKLDQLTTESKANSQPNYDIHDQIEVLGQRLNEVSQRHQQSEFLLKLLSKSQNDSYLDLLTEQVQEIKRYHLDFDDVSSSTVPKLTKPTELLSNKTGGDTKSKSYYPVPYFTTVSNDKNSTSTTTTSTTNEDTVTDNKPRVAAVTFSFQDYHNTIVKSCFEAIDNVLDTRQQLNHQESTTTPPPNPALFLLQPNRTLTAKEAMAFEMFLDSLE